MRLVHWSSFKVGLACTHGECSDGPQPLGHPSIPRIFAYGKSQYYEYLAMELLGCDLRSYFTTLKQPLTLRNLASIAYQMVRIQWLLFLCVATIDECFFTARRARMCTQKGHCSLRHQYREHDVRTSAGPLKQDLPDRFWDVSAL